jgi:hypothetical protein
MGYDLFVYTRTPVEGVAHLPVWRDWEASSGGWSSKEADWQVVVNASRQISEDDGLVAPLLKLQPKVGFVTEINVEGEQAQDAYAVALLTAMKLAKERDGAILDWQIDAMIIPVSPPSPKKRL